jgi:hypothetical protein
MILTMIFYRIILMIILLNLFFLRLLLYLSIYLPPTLNIFQYKTLKIRWTAGQNFVITRWLSTDHINEKERIIFIINDSFSDDEEFVFIDKFKI